MFQVFATCPETMGAAAVGPHARRVEAMGYDGLLVPDALHDGLLLAAMALRATRRLVVATGVLLAFPRSPMTTAIAAWDLQQMSAGRFELGLGTQIKANIEKRYAAHWGSPVPQLREYMQALRAIFNSFQTAAPLNFEGRHYRLTRLQPFFNPGPIEHPDLPILAGAVGPDMTRMVGRVADGMITHPTNSAPEYLRQVCLPRLRDGFARAGHNGRDFKLLLGPLVATGGNEQAVLDEWEKHRQMLGFLFSTPAYWPSLELFGWHDRGRQLRDMTRAGQWDELAAVVTDEVLEKVVPRGTYDEIAAVLKARYGGLAGRLSFPLPTDPADDERVADVVRQLRGD